MTLAGDRTRALHTLLPAWIALAAAMFAQWTAANLFPRALAHHR